MQTEPDRLSRMRQSLLDLTREVELLLPIFMDRVPMVKGSVYKQERKCGKPNCRCRNGRGHASMMLSRSEGGKTKLIAVPEGRLKELQILTRRYRRFRSARARLGQIYRKMLALIDELEAARQQDL
jgi:transposase